MHGVWAGEGGRESREGEQRIGRCRDECLREDFKSQMLLSNGLLP